MEINKDCSYFLQIPKQNMINCKNMYIPRNSYLAQKGALGQFCFRCEVDPHSEHLRSVREAEWGVRSKEAFLSGVSKTPGLPEFPNWEIFEIIQYGKIKFKPAYNFLRKNRRQPMTALLCRYPCSPDTRMSQPSTPRRHSEWPWLYPRGVQIERSWQNQH